jgi:hypothetical protein
LGVGQFFVAPVSESFAPGWFPQLSPSSRLAVGHDEDALPAMGCSEIARAEAEPLRIVPEAGQVAKNAGESEREVPWYVLQEEVARSKCANKPGKIRPEVPRVRFAGALACLAERLAGIAAADEVNRRELAAAEYFDVAIFGNLGPVLA